MSQGEPPSDAQVTNLTVQQRLVANHLSVPNATNIKIQNRSIKDIVESLQVPSSNSTIVFAQYFPLVTGADLGGNLLYFAPSGFSPTFPTNVTPAASTFVDATYIDNTIDPSYWVVQKTGTYLINFSACAKMTQNDDNQEYIADFHIVTPTRTFTVSTTGPFSTTSDRYMPLAGNLVLNLTAGENFNLTVSNTNVEPVILTYSSLIITFLTE